MSGTTSRGYPYPTLSDDVDIPGDMLALASAIDTDMATVAAQVVGDTDIDADSVATSGTTETAALETVTANLVSGELYYVELMANVSCDNVATPLIVQAFLREDSGVGTQVQVGQMWILSTSTIGFPLFLVGRYVAASTGPKTFAVTLKRPAGSAGAFQLRAGAGRHGTLRVVHASDS